MSKPATLPEWASTLATDGTTGQPNRAEPDSATKQDGWGFNQKPNRQHMNWFQWVVFKWLEFFDSVVDQDVRSGADPVFGDLEASQVITDQIQPGSGTLTVVGTLAPTTINTATSDINALSVATIASNDPPTPIEFLHNVYTAKSIQIASPGKLTDGGTATSFRGSDTGITGAELETLSGGVDSMADALHAHAPSFFLAVYGGLMLEKTAGLQSYEASVSEEYNSGLSLAKSIIGSATAGVWETVVGRFNFVRTAGRTKLRIVTNFSLTGTGSLHISVTTSSGQNIHVTLSDTTEIRSYDMDISSLTSGNPVCATLYLRLSSSTNGDKAVLTSAAMSLIA